MISCSEVPTSANQAVYSLLHRVDSPARETPRDESFCAHIVAQPATMIVPDALLDPRFAEKPGVVGAPHLRFYAGHPLVLAGGHCVGTFCIADVSPRQLDAKGAAYLAYLAEL